MYFANWATSIAFPEHVEKLKQDRLRVAIITSPSVFLTPDRAQLIINYISDGILANYSNENRLPQFKGNPVIRDGVIFIECLNPLSLKWLKDMYFHWTTLESQKKISFVDDDISDVMIMFISQSDVPKRIKCSITIESIFTGWNIHKRLIKQNLSYGIESWYYYGAVRNEDSNIVTITYFIPENIVESMRERNCEVSFGLGTVKLQINSE